MCSKNVSKMVTAPSGSFTMGSLDGSDDEGPQRVVTIGKPLAVGKFHITVDQFAAFVAETGYNAGSVCYVSSNCRYLVADVTTSSRKAPKIPPSELMISSRLVLPVLTMNAG
jgi:formylglycine-generating enzyme required for sulfatase activity